MALFLFTGTLIGILSPIAAEVFARTPLVIELQRSENTTFEFHSDENVSLLYFTLRRAFGIRTLTPGEAAFISYWGT